MKSNKKLKSPRNKGNNFERDIVNLFNDSEQGLHNLKARRMWGSDGRSAGYQKNVDVVLEYNNECYYKFQCKRLKSLPKYLGMEDNLNGCIFKEDRGRTMVLLPIETFIYTWNVISDLLSSETTHADLY